MPVVTHMVEQTWPGGCTFPQLHAQYPGISVGGAMYECGIGGAVHFARSA